MAEVFLYNTQGKQQENIPLGLDLGKKAESAKTYACAVRALLQNWRQGTVGCKTRGEVAFSNKKPWKQKGTGRARAGSLRSPLWRKGGVIFGPQPRVRTLSINSKQKKHVFNNIFFEALEKKALHCLDFSLENQVPSTKAAVKALQGMGMEMKKVVLFLPFGDLVNFCSFRNIPNVNVLSFDQPNVFDLSNSDCWVFLKKDLDLFKNMVERWN
jgi:large subunit ribosomal protein L4